MSTRRPAAAGALIFRLAQPGNARSPDVDRDADGVIEPQDLNDLSQSRFWGGDWLNIKYAAFDLE